MRLLFKGMCSTPKSFDSLLQHRAANNLVERFKDKEFCKRKNPTAVTGSFIQRLKGKALKDVIDCVYMIATLKLTADVITFPIERTTTTEYVTGYLEGGMFRNVHTAIESTILKLTALDIKELESIDLTLGFVKPVGDFTWEKDLTKEGKEGLVLWIEVDVKYAE